MNNFRYLLFAIFLSACSVGGIPPDGGPLRYDAYAPEHLCDPANVSSDFYHCGSCGATCSVADTDRCVLGECRCGIHEACGAGQDCRLGFCLDSDPSGKTCEFDEECDPGDACIEGHCSFMTCFPEVCDGIDNDCDGVVDGSATSPLAEWCYSGPQTNPLDIMDPCSAGVRVCEMGEWTECLGEVPPESETGTLACNGRDDNCDGCIDGNFVDGRCEAVTTDGFDIVFLYDPSSSMSGVKLAVSDAIARFASTFNRPDFRWAILVMPGTLDSVPAVYQDFTGYPGFSTALTALGMDSRLAAASMEPTYDTLYHLGNRDFGLSFRDDSIKIFIMFTDEGGQSFENPRIGEADACAAINSGEVFILFEQDTNWGDFNCANYYFELSTDANEMATNLESVIQDPCL